MFQVSADSTFFGISLNICAHFDILRESFDDNKKKFVDQHQKLLTLVEDLNNFYKPVVFTQFLVTSMLLCVLGFQLVMHETFFQKMCAAFFGLSVTIQLFFYAYGGQLITDKSSSVADLLYDTDKDLVLIIARAQKPTFIEAGIYKATSGTFRAIMSSACSLITLLQSLGN